MQRPESIEMIFLCDPCILEGSGVVISGVINPPIWVRNTVTPVISLLITTHEPPSMIPAPYCKPAILPRGSSKVAAGNALTRGSLSFSNQHTLYSKP